MNRGLLEKTWQRLWDTKNASKALADHVEECDKLNNELLSSLGQRGGWLINESGLYALIFGSKLESAKRFKNSYIQYGYSAF
jgi:prophage antirepressor-like protein